MAIVPNIGQVAPKVLLISLEFPIWRQARGYGYWFNLGLEEGFEANGIEYFTLTVGHHYGEKKASWLDYARELCAGQKFDQAWVEMVHSDLDERLLDWLTTVAPVRVGWSPECLVLNPEEWANNPRGCQIREESLAKRLNYFTHIVMVDEVDVDRFNQSGSIPAMWLAGGIMPKRFICSQPPPPRHNVALFYGTPYAERKSWLEHKALAGLIVRPSKSLEDFTPYPQMFDALQVRTQQVLESGKADIAHLSSYLSTLRHIRKECFAVWLKTLQMGCAVVNLPQLSKAYAGRVIEGMAAGRPVITWEIPSRPRTKALFEDGKDILLYSKDHPEQLAEHIRHIQSDSAFGQRIAENAQMKVESLHTTEEFVRQVFEWASGWALTPSRAPMTHADKHQDNEAKQNEVRIETLPQASALTFNVGANIGREAEVYPKRRMQGSGLAIFVGRARLSMEIIALAPKSSLQTYHPVIRQSISIGLVMLGAAKRGRSVAARLRELIRRRRRLLGHFYRFWFCRVVVDPNRILTALRQYRHYVREWRAYTRMPAAERLRLIDSYPRLEDRTVTTPFDAHYFYQAVWAMDWIARSGAKSHMDVGSEVSFVGMLSTHLPVTFVDIRPLMVQGVKNLSYTGGNLLHLPFASASIESLSCLHVAEHVGLGRYGDPLDPAGTRRACAELTRVLTPGGHLLFSVPVGRPRVCFNAHRIHSPQQILDYFYGLRLVQFSAIVDDGTFRQEIDPSALADANYACGLFHFIKQP